MVPLNLIVFFRLRRNESEMLSLGSYPFSLCSRPPPPLPRLSQYFQMSIFLPFTHPFTQAVNSCDFLSFPAPVDYSFAVPFVVDSWLWKQIHWLVSAFGHIRVHKCKSCASFVQHLCQSLPDCCDWSTGLSETTATFGATLKLSVVVRFRGSRVSSLEMTKFRLTEKYLSLRIVAVPSSAIAEDEEYSPFTGSSAASQCSIGGWAQFFCWTRAAYSSLSAAANSIRACLWDHRRWFDGDQLALMGWTPWSQQRHLEYKRF